MKIFVAVLLVGFGFLNVRAVADTGSVGDTNVVVITTGFINRLVAEALYEQPLA